MNLTKAALWSAGEVGNVPTTETRWRGLLVLPHSPSPEASEGEGVRGVGLLAGRSPAALLDTRLKPEEARATFPSLWAAPSCSDPAPAAPRPTAVPRGLGRPPSSGAKVGRPRPRN